MITFTVIGAPAPKCAAGLARVTAACAEAMAGQPPMVGPVEVSALALMRRPQRLQTRRARACAYLHPCRPDLDNLLKLILDGMAAAWGDDGQVARLRSVSKAWAPLGVEPQVIIRAQAVADTLTADELDLLRCARTF